MSLELERSGIALFRHVNQMMDSLEAALRKNLFDLLPSIFSTAIESITSENMVTQYCDIRIYPAYFFLPNEIWLKHLAM